MSTGGTTLLQRKCIYETNGNRKLSKKRYQDKIDNVAAMMDAYVAFKANIDTFS